MPNYPIEELDSIADAVQRIALVPRVEYFTRGLNIARRPEFTGMLNDLIPALEMIQAGLPKTTPVPTPELPDFAIVSRQYPDVFSQENTIPRRDLMDRLFSCYTALFYLSKHLKQDWYQLVLMGLAAQQRLASHLPVALDHMRYMQQELDKAEGRA